jgi:Glycosyltransferase family 10 (fucosyltransferase) C-term/Fucosyltransferase, N-terminal
MPDRLVLFYNRYWDVDPAAGVATGFMPGWNLSSDASRLADADAVVFHIPTMPSWSGIDKRPGQKWVAWSAESDVYYPHLRDRSFMSRFDLTMTYRLDSDVPVLYIDDWIFGQLRRPAVLKTEEAVAVVFSSNTRERSGRSGYLAELMKYIRVDSYGKWKPNRFIEHDTGRETKLDTIALYKFTLAFENSLSKDYVSEKFFDPLIAGSVPVYQGTSSIETFAPGDRCYINVSDFDSPRELAGYLLALDREPARYAEYLQWKDRPFRRSFMELVGRQREDYRRRLCRALERLF